MSTQSVLSETATRRLAAYQSLLEDIGLDLGGNTTGAEDAQAWIDEPETIQRFCVVTYASDIVYAYAKSASFENAKQLATENCGDTMFAESPGFIVDLDNGQRFEPVWESLKWSVSEEGQ